MTKNEVYLVDAVSWTEGEAILYREMELLHNDFSIKRMDPFKVHDMFLDESIDDKYLCNVVYITENDKGKEKRIPINILVSATDVANAHERVNEGLKTTLIPYEIIDVKKSNILEVFLYQKPEAA